MSINKFKNQKPQNVIQILLELIENSLLTFKNSEEFKAKCTNNPKVNEDTITSALRSHLDTESRKQTNIVFLFETQADQAPPKSNRGKNRTIDIAISTNRSKGLYVFGLEAKWLDARDYITTNTGAIKRFKKGEHGRNSANPTNYILLPENGIVAYAKETNYIERLQKINQDILSLSNGTQPDDFELHWANSEKLQQQKSRFLPDSKLTILKSQHTRIDNSQVILHHFWVYVS